MIQLIYSHEFDRCAVGLACIFTKHLEKRARSILLKFHNIDADNIHIKVFTYDKENVSSGITFIAIYDIRVKIFGKIYYD